MRLAAIKKQSKYKTAPHKAMLFLLSDFFVFVILWLRENTFEALNAQNVGHEGNNSARQNDCKVQKGVNHWACNLDFSNGHINCAPEVSYDFNHIVSTVNTTVGVGHKASNNKCQKCQENRKKGRCYCLNLFNFSR